MSAGPRLRIAVLSSLYPNSQQPRHGIFVEERLRALVASGEVEARVIAPVPWFFSRHPRFGRYARFASVARRETRYGIVIDHPRYPVIPRVGMTLGPAAMARGARGALAALRAEGFDFDVIDAHYFYPDGVAAARLAAFFRRPFTVTARGSDLNRIADFRVPRRQIVSAARRAGALISVSRALADRLEAIGVDPDRITTLRNGVDTQRFVPMDRPSARRRVDLSARGPIWLCVGHLTADKGAHIAIEALVEAPDVTLVLAGEGPDRQRLADQARRLGVAARLHFAGTVDHTALPAYYNAADALVFPTRAEGMPNVVLEAMACGCAVIATAVGGIPEVMPGPPAGVLMAERSAAAVLAAWRALPQATLEESGRAARRRYAEQFSWDAATAGQLQIFRRLARGSSVAGAGHAEKRGQAG